MQCILSGFDAFGDEPVNPSELAVKLVGDELGSGVVRKRSKSDAGSSKSTNGSRQQAADSLRIRKIFLPTCCSESWKKLRMAVNKVPPGERFAVVMCGLAADREKITLERFALNVKDYPIADNRGHKWSERPIAPGSPDAIKSPVALGKLRAKLNKIGLTTEISYHAGTFVCNELYYRALNEWADDRRCQGILFVHVPAPAGYARVSGGRRAASIGQFAAALSEIVKFVCDGSVPAGRARAAQPSRRKRRSR